MTGRWRLTRLLAEHERDEADRAALAPPRGGGRWHAKCGCWWDLPGTDDPQWEPCDAHAERLLRAVQGEEEL